MASEKGSVSQHKLTTYFPWDMISVGLPAKKSVSQAELKLRVASGTRRINLLVGRAEKVARLTKSSADGHQFIKLSTRNTIFSPTGTPTLMKSVRMNPHRASDLRPHSLLSVLVTEMAGWARWLACRLLKRRHQQVSGGTRHTCTASRHTCLAAFGYPRVPARSKGCFSR